MGSYLMHVRDQPRATARGEQVQKSSRAEGKHGGSRTPSPIRDLWKGFKAGFRHSSGRLDMAGEAANDGERTSATLSSSARSRSGSLSPARSSSPIWATVKGAFKRNKKKLSSGDIADASRSSWRSDSSFQCSGSAFSASLEASGWQLKKAGDGSAFIDPEDAMQVLACIDLKDGKFSPERALEARTQRTQQKVQSSCNTAQTTHCEHTAEPQEEWLRQISTVSKNADSMHRKAAEILQQKENHEPRSNKGRRERRQTKEEFRAQLEASKAALQEQLNRITSEFDAALDEARARVDEGSPKNPTQESARRGSDGEDDAECDTESSPAGSAR